MPFFKDPSGRYIVLYTFIARDENDVSVERGEFVTVLNKEDPDWYWIVRTDGQEGKKKFMKKYYIRGKVKTLSILTKSYTCKFEVSWP